MNYFSEFKKGIWLKNPVLVLNLAICPALAITTSVVNALWMSLAATFVLVSSNILVSIIKNFIPMHIRIIVFMSIIVTFVTVVEFTLHAFQPDIYNALGIYLPIMAVNCIILGRAEEFASKNGVVVSGLDGLGIGLGFGLTLFILSSVREVLGYNTFFGHTVIKGMEPISVMIMSPGAFFILGIMLWGMNALNSRKKVQ
jgi:Na+-translocating ferredoxin:NAD+ oxidoreductase subunit E